MIKRQKLKLWFSQAVLSACIFMSLSFISITRAESSAATRPQEMRLQSNVQGQRSQPKVLFILPWEDTLETQDIDIDDGLISEEDFLAPVDRSVFQRQLKMHKQLESTP